MLVPGKAAPVCVNYVVSNRQNLYSTRNYEYHKIKFYWKELDITLQPQLLVKGLAALIQVVGGGWSCRSLEFGCRGDAAPAYRSPSRE